MKNAPKNDFSQYTSDLSQFASDVRSSKPLKNQDKYDFFAFICLIIGILASIVALTWLTKITLEYLF